MPGTWPFELVIFSDVRLYAPRHSVVLMFELCGLAHAVCSYKLQCHQVDEHGGLSRLIVEAPSRIAVASLVVQDTF